MPAAERKARYPYTAAHDDPAYRRNRKKRYELARGACESCGAPLLPGSWECHHVTAARLFADPRQANDLANLRVLCKPCHKAQKRGD